ncbi:MAG TPA: serine hydrolase domain-containing protein [Rhizomicrobium sp.]|nr:serine hydrolase domain-containing protein [Rhizomicrobium sp.]
MRIVAACLVALSLLSARPAVAAPADIDSILKSAIAAGKAPALSMLVMREGKIARIGVTGVRRIDRPDPATTEDMWHIGSDAKPMTATLVALLVDRGVLSWDARLETLLPALAPTMRPQYRKATLLQLLTHRSGLPHDYHDVKYFDTFYADKRPADRQRYDYVSHALTDAPVAPPGAKFSYSNTGFILAAVIAERAAGSSYEEQMRREIFAPLGMKSAGFGPTPEGQPQGHVDGRVAGPRDANPAMFAPAGNIHLSLRDWAAFCLDQMAGYHGGGKILKTATYRMVESRVPGTQEGVAWGVQDSLMGYRGPVLTHAGSDGNWMAYAVLFPETQNGVLIAANAGEDMGGDKADKAALKAILPDLATPAAAGR